MRLLSAAIVTLGILASSGPAGAQAVPLDLAPGAWSLRGDANVGEAGGRDVLRLRIGAAERKNFTFSDGTIEFDMRPASRRAFVGVVFRSQPDGTGEDVYFRTHKSGLPDAIQYTPDYRGRGQWQLYHGSDASAEVRFQPDAWQHVRIEVRGGLAAVFVGDSAEPRLVARLRTDARSGGLGFWGNQPGAGEGDPWSAAIANIIVRPGVTRYGFKPLAAEAMPSGAIRQWGVSGSFTRDGDDVLALPTRVLQGPWRKVEVDSSGVVTFDQFVDRGDGTPAVLAGLALTADRARTVRLRLGYSDDVSVFLNGQLIMSGRNAFSTNFPRRQGLLLPEQMSMYLPLRAGRNVLVVAVSEIFGGWGVLGRIEDRQGLTIAPFAGP